MRTRFSFILRALNLIWWFEGVANDWSGGWVKRPDGWDSCKCLSERLGSVPVCSVLWTSEPGRLLALD